MKKFFFLLFIFHLSGSLFSQSQIPKDGVFISYWPGTQTISEYGFYKSGKKNGTWVTYENTGKLKTVYNYKDGEKEGTYIVFDVYGNPVREGQISKGYFTGVEYQYEAGKLLKKLKYLKPTPNQEYVVEPIYFIVEVYQVEYDLNTGIMRNEGKVVGGKKDSVWKWYDEKGNIKGMETLLQGKKQGLSERFFSDGKLAERASFNKGEYDGTRLMLTETGDTTEYGNYTAGKRNGLFKIHESVRVKDLDHDQREYFIEGNYVNGNMDGNFIMKYPNGKTAVNETYTNGKLNGTRKLFYKDGKLCYEAIYVNNKLNGKETKYYADGKVKQQTEYVNGIRTGKQINNFENGKVSEEVVYDKNGKMILFTRYYENGELREKRTYKDGKLLKQETFDDKGKKLGSTNRKPVIVRILDMMEENPNLERRDGENNAVASGSKLPEDTTIYSFVEQMPLYPGGNTAMLAYFGKNITYPALNKDQELPTKAIYSFVVEKDGSLSNFKTEKSCKVAAIDNEALRVIKTFPKFTPATKGGKAVRVKMNIPINCMLPK